MAQSPGAFSVVMATGIVSVASRRQFADVSITLLWVGIAAFVMVAVDVTRREVKWQGRRPRPTTDKWFDALTFVAAAAVMADRLGRADHKTAQLILSVAAVAAWVIPALAIARTSIAAPSLVSATGWFRPDLWIMMGALAITALAASAISMAPSTPLRQPVRLGGLIAWATALVLLPLLFACDAQVARRTRLSWPAAGRWSMVFPLGMLAAASQAYGTAESDQLIRDAGLWMAWVALAAWLSVAIGVSRNWIVWHRC